MFKKAAQKKPPITQVQKLRLLLLCFGQNKNPLPIKLFYRQGVNVICCAGPFDTVPAPAAPAGRKRPACFVLTARYQRVPLNKQVSLPAIINTPYCFVFSRSRISSSSTRSGAGAGGSGAASAACFFLDVKSLINKKIEKAIIRKSTVA